jgi:two-component system LytT family response regulator
MRLLIVDDERPARAKLRHLLTQLAAEFDITAIEEASDGVDALARIAAFRPDALLLDIDMPELSGIELAASLPESLPESLSEPTPLIVFVTAHDSYALQAFDADAIDYLLKPYDAPRLGRALTKLKARLAAGSQPGLALPGAPLQQLLVSDRGVTRVVRIADIGWLEAADNYVALHTKAGSPLLRQTLSGLVARLGAGFVRCHRGAAVQISWIDAVRTRDKGDGELVLRGGAVVPCSRQYRADVLARLDAGP